MVSKRMVVFTVVAAVLAAVGTAPGRRGRRWRGARFSTQPPG